MPEKPWWRRTRLLWINLVLYGVIAAIVVAYGSELRWSWRELPLYRSRDISAPQERTLYLRAAKKIERGELDEAHALLQQALDIDPYSDAWYWLGRYHLEKREYDQALEAFQRLLSFDRTNVDAYLQSARIHERQLRLDQSIEVLRQGWEYYSSSVSDFEPRPVRSAGKKFNDKALRTHQAYLQAERLLRDEISRVEYKLKLWRGDH